MPLDRLRSILGAAGVKAAATGKQGRNEPLIRADYENGCFAKFAHNYDGRL
jgi:hypothetical protein